MNPLVSIIIPVYNSEKYLGECIASAIAQTWKNKEIIIVDDGSTDDSYKVAEKYKDRQGIKIVRQKNKGASAARNAGLKEAKGEYIQFLDADDLLSPNKIADQMIAINDRTDFLSISRTVYFSGGSKNINYSEHDEAIEFYDDPVKFLIDMYNASANKDQRGIVTVHSWLTPKNLIEKAGWWNENLSVDDDGEFFCRVVLASSGIIYIPDAVNYYRKLKTETNLSARKDKKAMQSILLANELKYTHLKAISGDPVINIALARLFMENAVTFYPQFKDLFLIAMRHVNESGGTDYVPAIGGKKIEYVKKVFGWKAAKLCLFTYSYFQKKRIKKNTPVIN